MKRGLTSTVAANIGWQTAKQLRAAYGPSARRSDCSFCSSMVGAGAVSWGGRAEKTQTNSWVKSG